MCKEIKSKSLRPDQTAASAQSDLPAFLAPSADAPAYHGFSLVKETCIDGWCYGTISDFSEPDAPDGCHFGDGFVVAPDGSRAGIAWATDVVGIEEILPPDAKRWGVWSIGFSQPIQSVEDLRFSFSQVLPLLQEKYRQIKTAVPHDT